MKLINADCIKAMKAMPDNSVDSIVTDPPYELGFMGKSWDASGIAFNVEVWREALRVIKPGGHLIAFSGSRTYHRMAVAIEDAGFQIRDQIMWVYGSGFPKSHNISKGIDKASDFEGEVIGTEKIDIGIQGGSMHAGRQTNVVEREVVELSPDAAKWQGWGTALKPAHEPMVLARKPLEGTVANNVLTFGVGGLNIDATRVGSDGGTKLSEDDFVPVPDEEKVYGLGHKNYAFGKPVDGLGRFPANFIHDGSDEVVALFPDTGKSGVSVNRNRTGEKPNEVYGKFQNLSKKDIGFNNSGTAARFFYCAKASKRDRNEGLDGFEAKRDHDGRKDGGVGGDNPRNRTNNAKLNHHPTVKPTSLMQYLVRLVTPPNGIVLDPFMGSGSTGKACAYEGFDFIGIEQSSEYVAIAQARIDFALADKSNELPL
ncbi:MAG: site-specific DNA-methyltransferase [Caulobacteraceae bacterium]|nr:site-specific DNA-methyltransferase [Caulobacteraceae bacterium]